MNEREIETLYRWDVAVEVWRQEEQATEDDSYFATREVSLFLDQKLKQEFGLESPHNVACGR